MRWKHPNRGLRGALSGRNGRNRLQNNTLGNKTALESESSYLQISQSVVTTFIPQKTLFSLHTGDWNVFFLVLFFYTAVQPFPPKHISNREKSQASEADAAFVYSLSQTGSVTAGSRVASLFARSGSLCRP